MQAELIKLVELGAGEHCRDSALHARTLESPKARHTHHYVTSENGSEVAFIALDQIPGVEYLVLYEIYVRPECRGRGIGSEAAG